MVFSDSTFRFFSLVQSHVRTSLAESPTETPYSYREEFFFEAYDLESLKFFSVYFLFAAE
jgi:hypothetical protein